MATTKKVVGKVKGKSVVEGKNGTLHYGPGTKGGTALTPKKAKTKIEDVSISGRNSITKEEASAKLNDIMNSAKQSLENNRALAIYEVDVATEKYLKAFYSINDLVVLQSNLEEAEDKYSANPSPENAKAVKDSEKNVEDAEQKYPYIIELKNNIQIATDELNKYQPQKL